MYWPKSNARRSCYFGNAISHLFFHSDIKSANGIINNLVYVTPNRGLMYAGDIDNKKFSPRHQHLTCYLPGMLMLGVSVLQFDLTETEKEHHKWVAEGLAYTCYISYRDQQSNLGPEILGMVTGKRWIDDVTAWKASGRVGNPPGLSEPPAEKDKTKRDYSNWDSKYMLRPEVRRVTTRETQFSLISSYRQSKASTTCGGLLGTSNGGTAATKSIKPLRSIRELSSGMRASATWIVACDIWMKCQGKLYSSNLHCVTIMNAVASFLRKLSNIYTYSLTTRTPLISVLGCLIRRRTPYLCFFGRMQRRKRSIFGNHLFDEVDPCILLIYLYLRLTVAFPSIPGLPFRQSFHNIIYSAIILP